MVISRPKYILLSLLALTCIFLSKKTTAQASTENFGQNQIQYRSFAWKYYDSTNFRVFFYRPADKLAEHVLEQAEEELSNIVQKMGGTLPRKLNIVLYNSYSDYVQTNIGVDQTSDLNDADGGRLKVSGNNLPIYFTGRHDELTKQVKQGVANVIKDNMLYGNNIKEIVKNAIKMNLPEWYTMGYVEYISNDWTPLLETEVQNLITLDSSLQFRNLAQEHQKLVGHSFWHFMQENYGPTAVANLLYLSRFKKNVDEAIAQAVQKDADSIYMQWRQFYGADADALAEENTFGRTLKTKVKPKFEGEYSQFMLSPNGSQLAYVQRKDGEWKIILQETDLGDSKVLVSGGFKNQDEINDPNYPMIAWSPSGKFLATVYAIKDETLVRLYNSQSQRKMNKILSHRKMERVTGMCFSIDDRTIIFSGIRKGQSDIFQYEFSRNRVTNLTNDFYDDHSPSYVSSGDKTGILFLSNRPDTVMNKAELDSREYFNPNFNIFYFNQKNRATLKQVTETTNPISEPIQYGLDKFSYIEKVGGQLVRRNIEVSTSQSGGVQFTVGATSALPFNVLKHHYIPTQQSVVEVIKKNGLYHIYNTRVRDLEEYAAENPESVVQNLQPQKRTSTFAERINAVQYYTNYPDADTSELLNNIFNNGSREKANDGNKLVDIKDRKKKYRYQTTFNPKTLSTSLDNTLLFTRYQNVAQNSNGYNFPGLNGFLSFELLDILEDQKLTGGIRLPAALDGLSYFVQYANYKHRTDWKLTYFHTQTKRIFEPSEAPPNHTAFFEFPGRTSTEYLEGSLSYPFNRATSLRLSLGARYDKVRYLATNSITIQFPNDQEYWSFFRLEYVFDNTINPLINIRKGSRAKIFAEYQYRLNKTGIGFYQIGFDARNYTPIYKNLILASRAATGLSDGSAKLLYYLGGVDNPIEIKRDRGPVPNNLNEYAFQTTATNLRGYRLQEFSGSSYAMINEEIRLPIYNTFFKRPLKSAFLRNLQLVAFADIGAAWQGLLPLDSVVNPVYNTASQNVTANFRNNQDVYGLGYGVGVRTKLLGYFLRLDFAWNIEEGSRKPRIHLSMANDF